MANKNSNSRKVSKRAIPGYTLIPEGDHFKIKKIGLTRERVKNDPVFHNTRRLNIEFAHVQQVVKVIRRAFLETTNIKMPNGPLTKILYKALYQDDQNILGRRNIGDAPLPELEGFNFNQKSLFSEVFSKLITTTLNIERGQLIVQIPAINAGKDIVAPEGATHYKIHVTVASFCMQQLTFHAQKFHTEYLPLKPIELKSRQTSFAVNDWLFSLHIAAVHIEWFRGYKGIVMLLDKKMPQPACIIKAWEAFNKSLVTRPKL